LAFYERAYNGIDMNNLTFRLPDTCTITDACTYGLGGYSARTGRAWRWYLPPHLVGTKSINLLEFLASAVSIFLSVLEGELTQGDCHLSIGDNTSSTGWLRKSNFADSGEHEEHYHLARLVARTSLENGYTHYSQWLMGYRNNGADALSRENEMSDDELTTYIKTKFPSQVPENFKISPLPDELTSLLSAIVGHNVLPPASKTPRTSAKTRPGGGGLTFMSDVTYRTTLSSVNSPTPADTASSAVSSKQSEKAPGASPPKANSLMDRIAHWVTTQSTPPWQMWERPSPQRVSPTLDSTGRPVNLQSFYNDS
jgi:hypothetical protein